MYKIINDTKTTVSINESNCNNKFETLILLAPIISYQKMNIYFSIMYSGVATPN